MAARSHASPQPIAPTWIRSDGIAILVDALDAPTAAQRARVLAALQAANDGGYNLGDLLEHYTRSTGAAGDVLSDLLGVRCH